MRLSGPRVLTALAVALWAASLVPWNAGRTFWLVDASASVGGREAANAWLKAEGVGRREPRHFLFADGFARRDQTGRSVLADATELGALLEWLEPDLRTGDRLVVATDGCATDALPAASRFRRVGVEWVRLGGERPKITRTEFPGTWPESPALTGRLWLANADPDAGELEVTARGGPPLAGVAVRRTGEAELDVTVEATRVPEEPLTLRFLWREAGREAVSEVALGPAGALPAWSPDERLRAEIEASPRLRLWPPDSDTPGVCLVGPEHLAELAALETHPIERGWVLLIAAPRARYWPDVPVLRPLVADPRPEGALHFLLDRSGSMAEENWEDARSAVTRWVYWNWPENEPAWITPFGAEVEAPFDLRADGARSRLDELFPSGPTRLAEAVAEQIEALGPKDALVLVSDGEAEAPEEGWESLGARLRAACGSVACVPVGPEANEGVLRALGTLVPLDEESIQSRLSAGAWEAVADTLDSTGGRARPEPYALWTLPEEFPALGAHDRFRAAPFAIPLARAADGSVVAAALRQDQGLVVGIAAEPSVEWVEAFAPLAREFWNPSRISIEDGEVLLRGDGAGWEAGQSKLEPEDVAIPAIRSPEALERWSLGYVEFSPFVPRSASLWSWRLQRPREAVAVRSPAGWTVALDADEQPEFAATDRAWRSWLAAHGGGRPPARLRPWLLAAALLCAVGALGWRRLARPRLPR